MLATTLILSVIAAILAIQSQQLRKSVIYLGAFSALIALAYALYNAPDVAIAEAVIGTGLATILYVVTLQKYLIFTVYIHSDQARLDDRLYRRKERQDYHQLLVAFCAKESLEPQIIYTKESIQAIQDEHDYALIIDEVTSDQLVIYSHPENYHIDKLDAFLYKKLKRDYHVQFVEVSEEVDET